MPMVTDVACVPPQNTCILPRKLTEANSAHARRYSKLYESSIHASQPWVSPSHHIWKLAMNVTQKYHADSRKQRPRRRENVMYQSSTLIPTKPELMSCFSYNDPSVKPTVAWIGCTRAGDFPSYNSTGDALLVFSSPPANAVNLAMPIRYAG